VSSRTLNWAAFPLGLALLGLGVIVGAGRLARLNEPVLDFSAREQPVGVERDLPGATAPLRFAVATMVSAEATFSTYARLVERIGRDVGRGDVFILRPSYSDVRAELEQGSIDVAFVCTGTYVHTLAGGKVELLVQPEFEDGVDYRSLLIVSVRSGFEKLGDLRGAVVAFTDPESNTGYLVPTANLLALGHDPRTFFGKIVFTGSHDRSILAVALGVVDGAAVDSLVWFSKKREDPSLAAEIKVIWKSEPYGPPPILVPAGLEEGLVQALRQAFLNLDGDEKGRAILSSIGIKRFVPLRREDYQSVIELYRFVQAERGGAWEHLDGP